MEKLLLELFEKSKTNKKAFLKLKHMAVDLQSYEIACKLRELEKELFPDSEENIKSKEIAKSVRQLFKMVELDVPEDTAWLVYQTIMKFQERKENFNMQDACKLIEQRNEIFKI